jgi:alpha-methylacyl-CoA racemase
MLSSHTLLDFSTAGPGPRCTRLLADYGMRVIKIRPPAGGTRMLTTPWHTYSANRGIRQIHVDLKQEAGRRLVHRMLQRADVLLESYRPGVAARLGLGYEEVRAINEGIVYCSVSGFGQQGPYAQWPAHDINWLALGGFLHDGSRREDGGPALPGAVVADAAGGYSAAVAVLAALVRKAATGQGSYLDVSVTDSVLRVMQAVFDARLADENLDEKPAAHDASGPPDMLTGGSACYDVYQAADGRWLAVGAIEPHFWAALCTELGLAHRIPDQHNRALQDILRAELRIAFATRPSGEWLRVLGPVACVTPVNSPAETLLDPHLNARPLTVDVMVGGRMVHQLAPRLAVPDPPDLGQQPTGPTPAAEADAVLRELGIDPDEIADLRRAAVITAAPELGTARP